MISSEEYFTNKTEIALYFVQKLIMVDSDILFCSSYLGRRPAAIDGGGNCGPAGLGSCEGSICFVWCSSPLGKGSQIVTSRPRGLDSFLEALSAKRADPLLHHHPPNHQSFVCSILSHSLLPTSMLGPTDEFRRRCRFRIWLLTGSEALTAHASFEFNPLQSDRRNRWSSNRA